MTTTVDMLTGTSTKEVSLVDRAAIRRRFAVFKSEAINMDVLTSVVTTETEGESSAIEIVKSEKGKDAALGLFRVIKGFKDEVSSEEVVEILKAAGVEIPTETVEVEKAAPEAKPEPETQEIPEGLQAVFKAQADKVSELEDSNRKLAEVVKAERDTRRTREFVAKAEGEFSKLGDSQELGALLMELGDASPELSQKVEAVLKSAQTQISGSDLFKSKGSPQGGTAGDPMSQLESKAHAYVEKSAAAGKDVTFEQAFTEIVGQPENLDLYTQSTREG